MKIIKGKQIALTVAWGRNAETLDSTFASFAQNPFLELHAFILGDKLPDRRFPQINYHLVAPDLSFVTPMRDLYYRRWIFLDELDAEFAVVVDNNDVLCLQPIPEIPSLIRDAAFAGCVEHHGGRYIMGQSYTSSYINCGVTFWHVPSSRQIRREIVERGRSYFRSVDDQLTANEVIHARYYDQMILLPCQYNYRAYLAPARGTRWPVVKNLDGVKIYHNSTCVEAARKLIPVKPLADLPPLPKDSAPLTPRQQFWRKLHQRSKPHIVGAGIIRRLFSAT